MGLDHNQWSVQPPHVRLHTVRPAEIVATIVERSDESLAYSIVVAVGPVPARVSASSTIDVPAYRVTR